MHILQFATIMENLFICHQIINFDSARGGISLVTEKGLKSTSRLLIQRARGADAGVYTCGPNNAPPALCRVHVLSGKIMVYFLFASTLKSERFSIGV